MGWNLAGIASQKPQHWRKSNHTHAHKPMSKVTKRQGQKAREQKWQQTEPNRAGADRRKQGSLKILSRKLAHHACYPRQLPHRPSPRIPRQSALMVPIPQSLVLFCSIHFDPGSGCQYRSPYFWQDCFNANCMSPTTGSAYLPDREAKLSSDRLRLPHSSARARS